MKHMKLFEQFVEYDQINTKFLADEEQKRQRLANKHQKEVLHSNGDTWEEMVTQLTITINDEIAIIATTDTIALAYDAYKDVLESIEYLREFGFEAVRYADELSVVADTEAKKSFVRLRKSPN